jgi:nicotinamidase/pyrazinamidase
MNGERGVALLFWDVDTQNDFMRNDGRLYVPGAEAIVGNLEKLTATASEHRVPVLASADDHQAADPEISNSPDFRETYPPHCMRGTPGAKKIPETQRAWSLELGHEPEEPTKIRNRLAREHPTVLIHKKSVDVFSNPNTEVVLSILNPQRIVVYGVATDICNRAAIEGLLERGYPQLVLVTDAIRAIDPDRASRLVRGWEERGVELKKTDEIVVEVRGGQTRKTGGA